VRRGVMDPAAVQLFVARIAEYTHTQTRAGLI
jgi:hypothetical protein